MGLQPDAVTRAVQERLAVPSSSDDVPRRCVDRLRAHPRAGVLAGGQLCPQEHGVVVAEVGGRVPQAVGTGLVRAVAGLGGATDVNHHRVARLDHPIGDLRMGAGAVGSGGDDDEVDPDVTLGDDRVGDITPHLALGATDPQPLPHPRVNPVDGSPRVAQLLDLGCALAHPQVLQQGAGHDLPCVRHGGTEPQHLLGPHVVVQSDSGRGGGRICGRVGCYAGCHAGCRGAGAAQDRGDQRHRVLGLLPGHDAYAELGDG